MYDSDDDDDVSKGTGQTFSDDVKAHIDLSADTLAFGLVSPDDMLIIRYFTLLYKYKEQEKCWLVVQNYFKFNYQSS